MRVGAYEVERELGKGGMGSVYLARDPRSGAQVVVKTLRWADPASVERFEREAKIGMTLHHRGIVKTLSLEREATGPFLVMEHVAGETLAAHLARKPVDARRAAALVRDVALAVEHAHREGVLHRDLKPQNVIIDARGEPRVADFGLALRQGDERLSTTGEAVGTPSYLPPEQISGGSQAHGVPGDIWGLGAILYEALAGHVPFRASSPVQLLTKVANEPPEPLPAATPRPLAAIVKRCLEKDPRARFESAAALAAALDAWLIAGAAKAEGRSKLGPLLALLALAALVAVGAAFFWPRVPARPVRVPAPPLPSPHAAPPPTLPAPPPPKPAAEASLDELLLAADERWHANRYEQALAIYDRILARAPKTWAAHEGRAIALLLVNRHDECAKVVDAIPDDARSARGRLLYRCLHAGSFAELDDLAASTTSEDRWLSFYAATSYRTRERNFSAALANAQKAFEVAPWCARLAFAAAQLETKIGDGTAALHHFVEAERLYGDPPGGFFYERAQLYLAAGEVAPALTDATRALEKEDMKEALTFGFFLRGQILTALDRHADAIDDFQRAAGAAREPGEYVAAERWAADSALKLGRTDDALRLVVAALTVTPDDKFAIDTATKVFVARKKIEEDAAASRSAAQATPDEPYLWSIVAAAELARGDKPAAIRALEQLRGAFARKKLPTVNAETRIAELRAP